MTDAWRHLTSKLELRSRVFDLVREDVKSPRTGEILDAAIIVSPDWVNVLPLTPDGQVVLIHQYRFGTRDVVLEIPGGLLDPGEKPSEAARRELREETGYRCERVISLGSVAPNPAFIRNRLHVFLAEGCVLDGAQEQDPFEDIHVELKPLAELDRLLASGGLDHALVHIAFHRLALHRAGHAFNVSD